MWLSLTNICLFSFLPRPFVNNLIAACKIDSGVAVCAYRKKENLVLYIALKYFQLLFVYYLHINFHLIS